jgi:predicted DsbA family dithiol-disulfide isomerase
MRPTWERSPQRLGDITSLLALSLLGPLLAACSPQDQGDAAVLATIDGRPVRMASVDSLVGDRLALMDHEYQQERYRLVELALQRAIRNQVLEEAAIVRGLTLSEYMSQETEGQLEVSEEDIVDFYRRNMTAFAGRRLEDMHGQIEEYLRNTRREQVLDDLAARLSEAHEIVVLLEPVRAELNNEGSPAMGPRNAPVTVTEFSDFQCPYCRNFLATLNQLKNSYGEQLRLVYRHYPLDSHPDAFKAAEASLCAEEQGMFWEMHDLLFNEQETLAVDDLKAKAGRLGLDQQAFDDCLDSGRQAERIERDIREGDRLGIAGTPFVLVNGVQVPGGAAPFDVISRMIDQELERTGR